MRYLVTGCQSGLGKFLCRELQADSFNRTSAIDTFSDQANPFDVIIHCAFNANINISIRDFQQYIDDNVGLTERLLRIPHRKFIFISTVDVYPKSLSCYREDSDFIVEDMKSLYGMSKLLSESLVQQHQTNYLILRPTALLGWDARKNSLRRIIEEDAPQLTLAADSTFNYILHKDVLNFIQIAITENLSGVFNLAASGNITLGEVADHLQKNVKFGQYHYHVGQVINDKALHWHADLAHSSLQNIKRFLATRKMP